VLSPSAILCHRGRVVLFPIIERFPLGRKNHRMLLIEQLLPKSIHAVTSQGFELKVVLFVMASSLNGYLNL
jgi:hypothetical protein